MMKMKDNESRHDEKRVKKSGGLYAGVKISPKAADALVILSTGALALCLGAAIFAG